MKYQHIIWDWNGTLLDDVSVCVEILNTLLTRRNITPLSIERYRELFGFPVKAFYEQLGFDFQTESYERVADEYIVGYAARQRDWRLNTGAAETLTALSRVGLTHSVLSAYQQDRLNEAVEQFGLTSQFIKLIGLNDYAAGGKLQTGQQWIKQLNCEPTDVLLVGDTLHDHEVAQAMAVDCVLLTYGHQNPNRLTTANVPLFDSLTDLRAHLLA